MALGKLYMTLASPPVRAVLLTEKALGIELDHVHVNILQGEHMSPEYMKLNPQHTIPTYVDQDGASMWDSHAIMAFLVGKYGADDSLYPKDLAKRAIVDQRMHFDSGIVFNTLRKVSLVKDDSDESEPDMRGIVEAYDLLEEFLEGHDWVAGDTVTIADFCLIASVTTCSYFVPIDDKYRNILAWRRRCEALPFYSQTDGEGLKVFKSMMQGYLSKRNFYTS